MEMTNTGISKKSNVIVIIFASMINICALFLFLYDTVKYWNSRAIGMTYYMKLNKVSIIVLLLLGTIIIMLNKKRVSKKSVLLFIAVNALAYASLFYMAIYMMDLPYLWRIVAYILTVIIIELMVLLKIKKANCA